MHLTYSVEEKDFQTATRQKIISNTLDNFGVNDREDELQIYIHEGEYGNALFNFFQALLKMTDITYLSRERVRSTFVEDFRTLVKETVPAERWEFDYFDPTNDRTKKYIVDCRINHARIPLIAFAINSDDKCRDTTITMLQLEKWGIPF